MDKTNMIDIELPDGTLISNGNDDSHVKTSSLVDIELPEGYSIHQEGNTEEVATPQKEKEAEDAWRHVRQKRQHMGMRAKSTVANTAIYIVLVLMTIIWLVPFVCIVLESFRCESTSRVGYIIPKQWGFDNYINLFTKTQFPRWLLNTFLMGLVVAVLQTVIVLCVSYALSRLRFKMRKPLMNFMLILGMFPGFLTLILLYKVFSELHLTEGMAPIGLIIVYVASSGMGYYISKGYFDTVPRSLDEAARVDGATRFQVFHKIILPMAKPIVIYTVLMAFMAPWGDFVLAKYMAHASQEGMNVAVGLQFLISSNANLASNYTMFCAGGVVVALPITLLFMFLQKYYVAGVTGGAVKG